MSISNTFNWNRFLLVCKQNLINRKKIMLFASVGYVGVIFIVLTLGQLGNSLEPHGIETFLQMQLTFMAIFGILYVGYAFPSLRNKESSISYLTLPASTFEKLLFEFINRVVLSLIALPVLFWVSFNIHGLFFELFTKTEFNIIGLSDLKAFDISPLDELFWAIPLILSCILLVLVVPFTGAALFSKQPLIKTLFSIAVLSSLYFGMVYVIVEPLGVSNYEVNKELTLLPNSENSGLRFFACVTFIASIVMLIVAYLKIKEKEV